MWVIGVINLLPSAPDPPSTVFKGLEASDSFAGARFRSLGTWGPLRFYRSRSTIVHMKAY